MILIIMRHGEAVPYHINDESRALTQFGIDQSNTAGKRLAKFLDVQNIGQSIDHVLFSPFLRTQQTFEAVCQSILFTQQTVTDTITPMGDAQDVHDLIDGFADSESVSHTSPFQLMLISHMPLVSLLADKVCTGFNGKIFDTADILIIDYDPATQTGKQLALFQSSH